MRLKERFEIHKESMHHNQAQLQDQIWKLRSDMDKLLDHFGLKFQDINERRVVPQTETDKILKEL